MMVERILVGVCTYRRPELADTLRSLAALTLPEGASVEVVVADNDAEPSARALVQAAVAPFPIHYLHAPAHNISTARNAILDAARNTDLLAFIDDDEIADPAWLLSMWRQLHDTGADVVLGPVRAVYEADAPRWMRQAAVHDTRPTMGADGTIRTGYTCNVLIRLAAPALSGRRFELALGRSGGEDTMFFAAAHQAGASITYADDAHVHEAVKPERATFRWLLRRRYRMGQTHAMILRALQSRSRLPQAAAALMKIMFCGAAAAVHALTPDARNQALLRGALHAGTLAGLAGASSLEIYGKADRARPAQPPRLVWPRHGE